MKISKIFKLNKSQAELDFVDVDISVDTPLFIDPFFLSVRTDSWSSEASATIQNFFQTVITLIRAGKLNEARTLFRFLKEPNETCLGLSKGNPEGRGVGKTDADKIFNSIIKSKAVQTGLVEDLQDSAIFVDNIGKDKLSDMSTNIIRKHLIEYTCNQCNLLGIPLVNGPIGFFWNRAEERWESEFGQMLKVKANGQDRYILLIPKAIVSYNSTYTPQRYHQHFVLNFLQNEHLRLDTALVYKKTLKNGSISKKVYKKDLIEKEAPYDREVLRKFTQKHRNILEDFKADSKKRSASLGLSKFDNLNIEQIAQKLSLNLKAINPGGNTANDYHNLILGILDFLFYPNLIAPKKESPLHQGRKKIDISFDNAAAHGFFDELHRIKRIPCQYIIIECKNYTGDPTNPELDQLSGRFATNRGMFGLLTCRKIDDMPLFIERCRDIYKDNKGLILPLVDADFNESLERMQKKEYGYIESVLRERMRLVILS